MFIIGVDKIYCQMPEMIDAEVPTGAEPVHAKQEGDTVAAVSTVNKASKSTNTSTMN